MISLVILLILAWSFTLAIRAELFCRLIILFRRLFQQLLQGNCTNSLGEQINLLVPYASAQEGTFTYFFPSSQLFQLDKVFMPVWLI